MTKYLLKRILHGVCSLVIIVAIVMILVYSVMDRNLIFANDSTYTHQSNNTKITYKYNKWEEYGYLDYVPYADYLQKLTDSGEIDEETRTQAVSIARTADGDSDIVKEYAKNFKEHYEAKGYKVVRLDAIMMNKKKVADGGTQQLFAYKNVPITSRLVSYLKNLIEIDNIHEVKGDVGKRGITFTWHDPAYGGEKFSPAIMGNGTNHKYLVYFDSTFPYIHQNIVKINLGTSYSVNAGQDVFETMTRSQGSYVKSEMTFPTGLTEESADDLHTATYMAGSRTSSKVIEDRFTDDYTNVNTVKKSYSKIGFSFVIGILATLLAYVIGVPLGIAMARKKDKLVDKIGTVYIVFIIAVPSLAYIFLFKAIGGAAFGLPTVFDLESSSKLMYILPIVSLALPQIGNIMKWLRRYMIDQMNSDYVKFARSGGLTENEIFTKHIFKNAVIPIVQGIPAAVLAALTGAIITERVYSVPGVGNVLTDAINKYDNGVIVGVTLFYAVLTVTSLILGDVLMSLVDPRISFSSKDR